MSHGDEAWVLFSRPPLPARGPVFIAAVCQKPAGNTWAARFDRDGLKLRHALVYEAELHGASRAEVLPYDFNELCVQCGLFIRYVADGDGVAVQLRTAYGVLTVAPAKDAHPRHGASQ